jgi:integrase
VKFCQLTSLQVNAARAQGYYGDGSGLYLQVSKYGTRSWVFRFTLGGKSREMGLGSLNTFTLKEARERARECRQLLAEGVDPIEARQKKRDQIRVAAAKRITFEKAAERYIATHATSWRNGKHRAQWKATLRTYAFPVMGKLPVDAIDLPHILRVLEPIWTTKTETASRLRGRMERILAWATVRKYRRGENPARWSGHLDEILPSKHRLRQTRHHPAMPFTKLPDFMAELRHARSISARALEFTILTAARTAEVIGAKWPEIDREAQVWNVPGERMKSHRPHRVPLSTRAVEILQNLPREGDADSFIFAGSREKALSNMAMLELLRGMRGNNFTVHGFRSSFSDWARERTAYPRDVVEMALAHIVKDKSEAAYWRGDALEKRLRLMEEWARYCLVPEANGEVVSLRRGA